MNILYLVFICLVAIFSLFSCVSFIKSSNGLRKRHAEIVATLTPHRAVSYTEIPNINERYKKKFPETTKVYKHKGVVEYISLSVNHGEQKEFSIGGIMIHPRCYIKLAHKKVGLKLDDYLPDNKLLEDKVEELQTRLQAQTIDNKQLEVELEEFYRKNFYVDFEFIFLKEGNNQKQKAFLISINDWKI